MGELSEVERLDVVADMFGADEPLVVADVVQQPKRNFMAGGFDLVGRMWCKRQSKNVDLPDYLRLHYYAMSRMKTDGHCVVSVDALVQLLRKPGHSPMRTDNFKSRVLARAVGLDLLASESNDRCLVLPYDVRYMTTSDRASTCELH